jgi:hypothetical protein
MTVPAGAPSMPSMIAFAYGPETALHAVEAHREAAAEQLADGVEVEQALHQLGVVGDRVDHLHLHLLDARDADASGRPGRRR